MNSLKNFNKADDELFEEVEDWNDKAEILLDIDKMWDVLHFVLTGVDTSNKIKNNLLSESVVGSIPIECIEEFISYIEKTRIATIVSALESFDMEKALENFSLKDTSGRHEV